MSFRSDAITDCAQCVWWMAGKDQGQCSYRAASTASNEAWRQIRLGRCTHYLPVADTTGPKAGDGGD